MMRPVKYLEPRTLEEACHLLSTHKEEARLIAGGQSLIALLKQRLIFANYLIDIKGFSELDYIKEDGDNLRIGALTTLRAIERSSVVNQKFPMLKEAMRLVGHVQIRNWGTIGGSLAHADPAGDAAPVLIALGARVEATSTQGQREISIEDFFVDYLVNALNADEILTGVIIPYLPAGSNGVYLKEVMRAGDTGIASVAVTVNLNGGQEVKESGIVFGCQAGPPIRAINAEKAVIGKKAGDSMEDVAKVAAEEANFATDVLGSAEYKKHLAGLMIQNALQVAISDNSHLT